jgi:transcription factor E
MQVKLLHDLVEELAGVDTGRIVKILFGKKDVNEFLIAKKMELTINQVRNILYKLSADGLVSFIRKKDKRKGWYIYYWTLKTEKCLMKLEGSLASKIDGLHHILGSRETKRFYVCKSCMIEVGEEKALEHGFSCEECAEVYELSDNSGPIRETKAKITRTERDLKLIRGELEAIREKEHRKRARVEKKEAKAEVERKVLMKAVRAAARKKIAKDKASRDGGSRTTGKKKGKVVGKKKVVKKKIKKKIKKIVKRKAVGRSTYSKLRGVKTKKIKKIKKKIGFAGKLRKKFSKKGR